MSRGVDGRSYISNLYLFSLLTYLLSQRHYIPTYLPLRVFFFFLFFLSR